MKLLLKDREESEEREIDIILEPIEQTAIEWKSIMQKCVDAAGLQGLIENFTLLSYSREAQDYLVKEFKDGNIEDTWDLLASTSKFYKHDSDAKLIRILKRVEKENEIDLVDLVKRLK